MKNMSIVDFCKIHGACRQGREWALANCKDMAEAWIKLKPEWFLWVATREGVLSDRDLREFTCWCVRNTPIGNNKTVWSLLVKELDAAYSAAYAASAAAYSAAWDAAWDAQAEYLRSIVANPFAGE